MVYFMFYALLISHVILHQMYLSYSLCIHLIFSVFHCDHFFVAFKYFHFGRWCELRHRARFMC